MTRDPKDLWRNQHTEGVRMSAEEVRLKAEKVRAITWRNTVIFFVLHLVAIGVCLFALLTTTFTATRLIAALAIVYIGVVWIRSRIRVRSLLTECRVVLFYVSIVLSRVRVVLFYVKVVLFRVKGLLFRVKALLFRIKGLLFRVRALLSFVAPVLLLSGLCRNESRS